MNVLLQPQTFWKPFVFLIFLIQSFEISAAQTNYTYTMSNEEVLDRLDALVNSSDVDQQLLGITLTRQRLFHPNRTNFEKDFIKRDFLPVLVNGLKSKNTKMQLESAAVLAVLAEGDYFDKVAKAGAIPPLVNLIYSDDTIIAGISTLAVAQLIAQSTTCRDQCIDAGVTKALIQRLDVKTPLEILHHATYGAGRMFFDNDSQVPSDVEKAFLPALIKVLKHEDVEVLKETLLAISYLLGPELRGTFIKTGVAKEIMLFLEHKDPEVQLGAIKVLGNIAAGTEEETQYILDIGTLPLIKKFLTSSNEKLNKEGAWFLMNFLAGTEEQIQQVFDAKYIPLIIKHLKNGDFETQQKAAKCILNVAVYGSGKHISSIFNQDVFYSLSSFLMVVKDKESRVIELALQAIEKIILNMRHRKNDIFDQLLYGGGIDVLRRLSKHESEPVKFGATFILASLVAVDTGTTYVIHDEV